MDSAGLGWVWAMVVADMNENAERRPIVNHVERAAPRNRTAGLLTFRSRSVTHVTGAPSAGQLTGRHRRPIAAPVVILSDSGGRCLHGPVQGMCSSPDPSRVEAPRQGSLRGMRVTNGKSSEPRGKLRGAGPTSQHPGNGNCSSISHRSASTAQRGAGSSSPCRETSPTHGLHPHDTCFADWVGDTIFADIQPSARTAPADRVSAPVLRRSHRGRSRRG
jgi:hypothetical protein